MVWKVSTITTFANGSTITGNQDNSQHVEAGELKVWFDRDYFSHGSVEGGIRCNRMLRR
jgi:hypothetical protein